MAINRFQSSPLSKEKRLVIKRFRGDINNLKVIRSGNIIVGVTESGLQTGVFYCSDLWERHDYVDYSGNTDTHSKYLSFLSCLVKFGYLTRAEKKAEMEQLARQRYLAQMNEHQSEIVRAFRNPEFIKWLEAKKDDFPEFLTQERGYDRDFAVAIMRMKAVIDGVDPSSFVNDR